jgi:hypothetical protein
MRCNISMNGNQAIGQASFLLAAILCLAARSAHAANATTTTMTVTAAGNPASSLTTGTMVTLTTAVQSGGAGIRDRSSEGAIAIAQQHIHRAVVHTALTARDSEVQVAIPVEVSDGRVPVVIAKERLQCPGEGSVALARQYS